MGSPLSEGAKALLDGANFATLATLNPDGSPQTSVLWIRRDGDDVLLSTVAGRQKEKNLRRDPRVSVTVYAKDNPYSYIEVRGAAELTTEGGDDLINELSEKYTGKPYSGDSPDTVRVVVRITPERVTGHA
ncbi:PPOX class F420-dependent oxidoreductase [Actinokineospora globicatena]|uniref:PPOX class F420-dependent enzyme n=1 Tax=Actinokineospora globicatena TaxID=103729 RepID=A0A9W6QR15_9PSEU|nr:PPOX class F420-dependent oxidoreductase [Actinokineospora globicatena]MCP2300884.1 PPOX class probable F420-dependent enzyme [Actinokineospora globicatena]GLW77490.1 PPOX class F420-dependent enzyme [Actinokineospora globicatena]GLW84324.1 PPOX class F420-dependent enzyme [Actinokineospora globicatena]GLW93089.1 PPOX class F420-dependent enzyme [Actinokineospora globicatena]